MAPIRPSSKSKARQHIAKSAAVPKPPSNYPSTPTNSLFSTTKKDKRIIKHSILLSKIRKSAPKTGLKRRRASKKLVTTLESLADALPSVLATSLENAGVAKPAEKAASLKSKPGVRKKRERMEKLERERFGKNLAILSQARGTDEAGDKQQENGGRSERWAALRAHIEASMGQSGARNGSEHTMHGT